MEFLVIVLLITQMAFVSLSYPSIILNKIMPPKQTTENMNQTAEETHNSLHVVAPSPGHHGTVLIHSHHNHNRHHHYDRQIYPHHHYYGYDHHGYGHYGYNHHRYHYNSYENGYNNVPETPEDVEEEAHAIEENENAELIEPENGNLEAEQPIEEEIEAPEEVEEPVSEELPSDEELRENEEINRNHRHHGHHYPYSHHYRYHHYFPYHRHYRYHHPHFRCSEIKHPSRYSSDVEAHCHVRLPGSRNRWETLHLVHKSSPRKSNAIIILNQNPGRRNGFH